ncbi:hypothetical protein MPL3356_480001 [Mesorhizobium plurifarium]|uniref:Uncharacterized protein n=1 Tax=Mesorhizobium plurifarium TaxID=69974 RepID=A0A090GA42_MESPL|nr:hypothetical protein MPL3356_480001 [Mesorhizobium plurifarium]CDX60311.1 hypothetical protein MPL3365_350001 [Mesorhizobium plurifarium]
MDLSKQKINLGLPGEFVKLNSYYIST